MNSIEEFIERLQTASTAELPELRSVYEAHLENLSESERAVAISRIEPILKILMNDSILRLEEAASVYFNRQAGRVLVS